jgi:hypothetical protein
LKRSQTCPKTDKNNALSSSVKYISSRPSPREVK